MKGVDPATHDVSAELASLSTPGVKVADQQERIRTYYGKVKAVEEPESRESLYQSGAAQDTDTDDQGRTSHIDKAAAGRIIRHSIPASQRRDAESSATTSAAASARAQAEAAVNEQQGTSHRFRFVAKDAEKVDVDMSESEEEEDTPGAEAGAENFLNDLEEEFGASRAEEGGSLDKDDDGKKRKRAEDFGELSCCSNICQ
jgi:hypothetical protein